MRGCVPLPNSFLKDVVRNLKETNISYLAASIAYFMILSLVPLLLLIISIFGFITKGIDTEISNNIIRFVQSNQLLLKESIHKYIEFATRYKDFLGVISILVLLWTSKGVVFALDFSLDQIMQTTTRKPYLKKLLDTVIMLFIVIFLFTFSMFLTLLTNYINTAYISGSVLQVLWHAVGGFLPYLFSLIISIILFYSIYRILPMEKPFKRFALTGAIIGAVIWHIINIIFGWYLTQTLHYEIVYGSVAAFIYVVLWVYFFAISILIGSVVIKVSMTRAQA